MKSQKGITLMSLMIYVVSFLMIVGVIGAVTTFFYTNYSFLDEKSAVSAEYSKLNLVFVEESKKAGNSIYAFDSNIPGGKADSFSAFDSLEYESKLDLLMDIRSICGGNFGFNPYFDTYILFYDENFIGWRKSEKTIYYNQNVLCRNVDNLVITKSTVDSHEILNVFVQFDSKSFSTKYVF